MSDKISYYYDDDAWLDHFKEKQFESDNAAIMWAEKRFMRFNPTFAIVYTEEGLNSFRTVKEFVRES